MEIPQWFNEKWIDTDAKSLGVYIALLYARFRAVIEDWSKESTMNSVKKELARFLSGKEGYVAWKSAEIFIENLYSNEYSSEGRRFENYKKVKTQLENIEGEYYDKFRKACYKYFKKKYINELKDEDKEDLRKILESIKLEASGYTSLGSILYSLYTTSDAYKLATGENIYSLKGDEKKEQEKRMENIIYALIYSGILWFKEIIPAPFLEDEFIKKLSPPEDILEKNEENEDIKKTTTETKNKEVNEIKFKFDDKTPDWKVLEEIVANVLKSMGFDYVEIGKRLPARGGGTIEVDVWSWKRIGNTKFYVYASCKNWKREVDRRVIDEEFGRTQQLNLIPHIKIFIAKRLTDPARQTALADGFITIELEEKATSNNAREIYEIIAKHLKDLFIGIAPPELQKFAKEAKEISERMKSLAEEIERLSG
ncbi:restriction endonuclease [Methanocaldococcus sp. 28A]